VNNHQLAAQGLVDDPLPAVLILLYRLLAASPVRVRLVGVDQRWSASVALWCALDVPGSRSDALPRPGGPR
jgi:hypothetical protein